MTTTMLNDEVMGAAEQEAFDQLVEAGLLDELMERVDAGQIQLTGEGGCPPGLIKAVLERGLAAELTGHSGYETGDHDPSGTVLRTTSPGTDDGDAQTRTRTPCPAGLDARPAPSIHQLALRIQTPPAPAEFSRRPPPTRAPPSQMLSKLVACGRCRPCLRQDCTPTPTARTPEPPRSSQAGPWRQLAPDDIQP
jgi:hypothetical protein